MTIFLKKSTTLFTLILVIIFPKIGYTQYLIAGKVDTNSTFKIAHLDILNDWDSFSSISDETVVKSVKIASDGTFTFTGSELSKKKGFYRIRYSKDDQDLFINSTNRNYINFIFSNRDSIKIVNTSYASDYPQNDTLLKYFEINDAFIQQQLNPINELNSNMHSAKHKEYCRSEIQQSNHGLLNAFLLYSSEISIQENPSLFKKVQNELKEETYRAQYYNSLSGVINANDYRDLDQRNKWLWTILIASLITNAIIITYLISRKNYSLSKSSEKTKANLTNKEIEVLQLIKANKTNKEIASEMYVSESTIKTHINNIYRKMNIRSRQEAINSMKN